MAFGLGWPVYAALSPSWPTHAWSEGLLSGYAVVCADPARTDLCARMTKTFWHRLFVSRKIATPRMYAQIRDRQVRLMGDQPASDAIVLTKPNRSCAGHGVHLKKWADILRSPPLRDTVVQEYISHMPGQSYRVVTCKEPNTDAFTFINYVIVNSATAVASNRGVVTVIDAKLVKSTDTLCRCHTLDFAILPAICWDIVVDANGDEFVLEGNAPGAICWKTECRIQLSKFDRIVRSWL